jgi:hypothetical protein
MKRQLIAVALALAVGGPAGEGLLFANAAGADSVNNPKADIESGNFFCGFPDGVPVIGFTNYHRSGNTVSVEYHLKNGIPDATYVVELWGDVCSFFGTVATVTTNDNGVANGNGSVTVPGYSTRFFATGIGPNGANDTPAVTLNP